VWAAARIVADERKPALELDPASTRGTPGHEGPPCQSAYRLFGGSAPANADGLYAYQEWQRRRAGKNLHDGLEQDVKDKLAEVTAWGLTKVRPFVPHYFTVLLDMMETLVDLNVTSPLEAALDVHRRVADIVCNLFAFDDWRPSDRWETPGDGVSVSPDDIASWWQENRTFSDTECLGVYGYSAPARFRPPMTVARPPLRWTISEGPGAVEALVRLVGDDRIPVGAVVEVACRSTVANVDGWFRLDVPQGTYLLTARWFDPQTTWVWEGAAVVDVPLWATVVAGLRDALRLSPPPERRRRVRVLSHSDVVNRHLLFKHDWWDHRDYADDLYLVDDADGEPTTESPEGRFPYNSGRFSAPIEDIGVALVDFWVQRAPQPNDPFAVRFKFIPALREHNADKIDPQPNERIVGANQSVEVHISMMNQEALEAPERAWFTLRITNDRLP
jgi:hypothetical protein